MVGGQAWDSNTPAPRECVNGGSCWNLWPAAAQLQAAAALGRRLTSSTHTQAINTAKCADARRLSMLLKTGAGC